MSDYAIVNRLQTYIPDESGKDGTFVTEEQARAFLAMYREMQEIDRETMGDDLESIITSCINRKIGNKDFALFQRAHDKWEAHLRNPSLVVSLGETEGEYVGRGRTARMAVLDLEAILPR